MSDGVWFLQQDPAANGRAADPASSAETEKQSAHRQVEIGDAIQGAPVLFLLPWKMSNFLLKWRLNMGLSAKTAKADFGKIRRLTDIKWASQRKAE